MAEQMEAPPKQIAAFFNVLFESAPTLTRMNSQSMAPVLGKLVKAERAQDGTKPGHG